MTEKNSRHLKLINELIQAYECGNIKLYSFVNRLEILIQSIDNPPEIWIKSVQLYWEELEIINALLLSEDNPKERLDELKPKIHFILHELSKLISSKLISGDIF